jgi:hypothetical protein
MHKLVIFIKGKTLNPDRSSHNACPIAYPESLSDDPRTIIDSYKGGSTTYVFNKNECMPKNMNVFKAIIKRVSN